MRIKDNLEESRAERAYRTGIVDRNMKIAGITMIPAIFFVVVFIAFELWFTDNAKQNTNIGNPYECKECKELGVACKEHQDFDSNEALKNKIESAVRAYKFYVENGESEEDNEYFTFEYYEGYDYNPNCDFCTAENKECDGCKYTKLRILEYIKQQMEDEDTFNRLSDEDKKKGYPYSVESITYISEQIYNELKAD